MSTEKGLVFDVQTMQVTEVDVTYAPPNITELRESRIVLLKENGTKVINEQAPDYKQLNAALGIYSAEEANAIKKWIQAARQAITEKEMQILLASNGTQLDDINVEVDSIRTRLQALLPSIQI